MGLNDDLLTRPCTITYGVTAQDTDGAPLEAITGTVSTVCALQQQSATEVEGVTGESTWRVWLLDSVSPAPTRAVSLELVDEPGIRYDVLGEPWLVADEFAGVPDHWELTARRVS